MLGSHPDRGGTTVSPKRTDILLPPIGEPAVTIDAPTVFRPYAAGPGIDVIPAYLPVPGMGVLPANSFLVRGAQPLLVDAGPCGAAEDFIAALSALIDPAELRWLWLTHTDPDHIGALSWLLEHAPQLRVVTTYLAVGKLGMYAPLPMDRVYWCNPGERLDIGDRSMLACTPPSFDAPETTALFDPTTRTLFSADSFGALLHSPVATADEVPAADLEEGLVLWSTIDSPWLRDIDRAAFAVSLAEIDRLAPTRVLSAHLPPATAMRDDLLGWLRRVPDANPCVGPNQTALDALLTQIGG
jgi:glyoxylase-like metal-dependent hydrolase (beta-lactamase superfamily II)